MAITKRIATHHCLSSLTLAFRCVPCYVQEIRPILDAVRMLKQVMHEIRLVWPRVRFEITADAAFAAPELFEFCEGAGVTYFIGVGSHSGLAYHSQDLIAACKSEYDSFGFASPELKKYGLLKNPADRQRAWRQREERIRFSSKDDGRMQEHFEDEYFVRKYSEFRYQSREWTRERRFIYRVHYTSQGPDTRYVVTNAATGKPRQLYDEKYCSRAQCENWIKDLKTYLHCDRTSCQEFEANQFRLFLHVFAYILIWDLRTRAKLRGLTVHTFQLRFLKVGVFVKQTAGKVRLCLSSHHPWQDEFQQIWNSA